MFAMYLKRTYIMSVTDFPERRGEDVSTLDLNFPEFTDERYKLIYFGYLRTCRTLSPRSVRRESVLYRFPYDTGEYSFVARHVGGRLRRYERTTETRYLRSRNQQSTLQCNC
jgi:hypothetical protein